MTYYITTYQPGNTCATTLCQTPTTSNMTWISRWQDKTPTKRVHPGGHPHATRDQDTAIHILFTLLLTTSTSSSTCRLCLHCLTQPLQGLLLLLLLLKGNRHCLSPLIQLHHWLLLLLLLLCAACTPAGVHAVRRATSGHLRLLTAVLAANAAAAVLRHLSQPAHLGQHPTAADTTPAAQHPGQWVGSGAAGAQPTCITLCGCKCPPKAAGAGAAASAWPP